MPARLAQILVDRGLVPPEKAGEAARHHQARGGALDTAALELGLVGEPALLEALAESAGVRAVNLPDFEPNPEVASLIPPKVAERLCVAPLSLDGSTLHLACGYPVPRKDLEEIAFLLGKQLELWVAVEGRVRQWISLLYKQPLAARYAALVAKLDAALSEPAPVAGPPAAPVPEPAGRRQLVEEDTLEASLSRAMVERLAESVAQEPIPLAVKKPARSAGVEAESPTPAEEAARAEPPPAAPAGAAARTERADSAAARGAAPPGRERSPSPPRAPEPVPPPAYTREPLRFNAPPGGPSGVGGGPAAAAPSARLAGPAPSPAPPGPTRAPQAASSEPRGTSRSLGGQAPLGPAVAAGSQGPGGEPIPPPAYTREPLRFNAPPPAAEARPGLAVRAPADPQFLVFPNPGAPSAPPPVAAAPRREDVPEWTLEQARAALRSATRDRHQLIDTVLRFGRRTFDYAAAFVIQGGAAVGLESRGEGLHAPELTQVSIPLDAASVFRTVAAGRATFTGPLPPDGLSQSYLSQLGRTPRTVFLHPVEVKGRLIAILYGDNAQRPTSQRRLADFALFCQELGAAFHELILFRKQRLGELHPTRPRSAFSDLDDEEPAAPVASGVGWSRFAPEVKGSGGRAASLAPRIQSQGERPPPDFTPVLNRLTGPEAAQRAGALAELARTPEASARVLAAHFPGPTAWSRLPVVELPEPDELGPVPGALARLGRHAAQALVPLLQSQDADVRYFALLVAGSLPYPELLDGVVEGLFAFEPDISSAARVSATALKGLPRFESALKSLRLELRSQDPLRCALAARALGAMHDRDAIEPLIYLTGSAEEVCAQAAAEALHEITRASFGVAQAQWIDWWNTHRQYRRADWLIAALRHPEYEVRLAAIEELSPAFHDVLGYFPDRPAGEREAAVRRWEAIAADPASDGRLAGI